MYGKMSLTERLTVGIGAAVIVLSLVLTVSWAGRPEYVPVVFNQLDPVETGGLLDALAEAGFETRLEQGQVRVRSSDLDRARIAASRAQALPTGKDAFAVLVDEVGAFATPAMRAERMRILLQRQLIAGIRTIAGVRDAQVLLTPERNSPLEPQHQVAKASVLLTLARQDRLDSESIRAIRQFVVGSWPGLEAKEVLVQDHQGHTYPTEETEGPFGGATSQLALERQWEREEAAKVREAFGELPDPVYIVADLELRPIDSLREESGAPAGEEGAARPLTRAFEHTESPAAGTPAPVGVRGNLAADVVATASPSGGNVATTENEVTGYQVIRTVKLQEREVRIEVVGKSISVTVPWLRKEGPDGEITYEDPSGSFADYRGRIGRATGIVDESKIHLSAYRPVPPVVEGAGARAGRFLAENFQTVTLAVLAVGALWTLGSLARRAMEPAPVPATETASVAPEAPQEEGPPVDDRESRVQGIVDRDARLAAGLLKRWLSNA